MTDWTCYPDPGNNRGVRLAESSVEGEDRTGLREAVADAVFRLAGKARKVYETMRGPDRRIVVLDNPVVTLSEDMKYEVERIKGVFSVTRDGRQVLSVEDGNDIIDHVPLPTLAYAKDDADLVWLLTEFDRDLDTTLDRYMNGGESQRRLRAAVKTFNERNKEADHADY